MADAVVTAQYYVRSWYEDDIHEYGLNEVLEYFVRFQGRGLCFHLNKDTQKAHCFFCEGPKTTYRRGCQVKITALVQETTVPVAMVQQYFDMALMQEKLHMLEKSATVPEMVTPAEEQRAHDFDKALAALKTQAYAEAEQGFRAVLFWWPGHLPSLYNLTCVYSLQNKLEKAAAWLRITVDAGYTDVLTLLADGDLHNILHAGRPDVRKLMRFLYGHCIQNLFQGNNNQINVQRYAQYYRTISTEQVQQGLQELQHFGIDVTKRWNFDDGDDGDDV